MYLITLNVTRIWSVSVICLLCLLAEANAFQTHPISPKVETLSLQREWLDVPIKKQGMVAIPQGDSPFRLSFPNEYPTPFRELQYRWVEQHTPWQTISRHQPIVCQHLPHGKHGLEIRMGTPKNGWTSQLLTLHVPSPNKLRKQSFYGIMGLLIFLILGYLSYQYRLLYKLHPRLLKKDINQEINTRIEGDLARMFMEIELLKTGIYSKKQEKKILSTVSNSSRRVISTISDTLWMIDARKDSMGHLLDRLLEQAQESLGQQGIHATSDFNILSQHQILPFHFKRHIFLFFKELMETLAMNEKLQSVHIRFEEQPAQFQLSIELDREMAFNPLDWEALAQEGQALNGDFEMRGKKEILLAIPKPETHRAWVGLSPAI